jgi:hypothetical protein
MSGAFEHKILSVSQSKQAGLLNAAKIAASKPDTGVTIVKKSAYFVIRDCAKITEKYLVHHIWGEIKNPIDRLEGAFTKAEIEDFLSRSKRNTETQQLCSIILEDIHKKNKLENSGITTPAVDAPVVKFDFTEFESDKIYGDYDTGETQGDVVEIPTGILPEKEKTTYELFLEAFKPKL